MNKLVVQSYETTAKQFKRNYDTQVQQSKLFVINLSDTSHKSTTDARN